MDAVRENVVLTNDRGVTVSFWYCQGALGGYSRDMLKAQVSQADTSNFVPGYPWGTDRDCSDLGEFMVARVHITGEMMAGIDDDYVPVDSTLFAVIPTSRLGEIEFAGQAGDVDEFSFDYPTPVAFIAEAPDGTFTEKEEELLREVMSEEFRNEIPSFGVGSDVANLALTKVGCRYSQEHRYEEGYYDCSSLVQRLYQEVGISLPAIASTQGEFMVTHGLEVTEGELEPGDLIFYSYEQNGQFRNISHVAIYVGNGRMVHAANSRRGVVNDPFNPSNIGLYGRPSRLQ